MIIIIIIIIVIINTKTAENHRTVLIRTVTVWDWSTNPLVSSQPLLRSSRNAWEKRCVTTLITAA